MVNYREILRLRSQDYSQHQIAASTHSSRNTIRDVFQLADAIGLKWPIDDTVTNEAIGKLLYPSRGTSSMVRKEPDYSYIHEELAKKGVNLTLLWTEYCATCHAEGSVPYMYTHFCDKYREWARVTKATMRIKHKPGELMEVDWAGATIPYYDSVNGQQYDAYLFVAVLPCSFYAYAEACNDTKSTNWLLCHVHAYQHFGGVTRLLTPDNLKTGIVKNTQYETMITKSYQELADYYDTAIVPARVRHPKDKPNAEGTVKFVSTWIIAALRNHKFFSLEEVNLAVAEKLNELNHRPFQKREGCRHSAYFSEEKEFMKPLPFSPYEPAVWSTAKVPSDYLISDGKNKYSVPFDLIGETVDIRITKDMLEVFFHGSRVASHPKSNVVQRNPIVQPEHMPMEHRKYLSYNAEEFQQWADSIGRYTGLVVKAFLTSGKEPEQGYKSCASLTKLGDKYGTGRLERACERVLQFSSVPTIRNISTILKNGQDKVNFLPESAVGSLKSHGITRGAAYFRKGGEQK